MKPLAWALGAAAFLLLATANSGGYRYGVSDQAFYATAVVKNLRPASFPRDSRLLDVESGLMLADEIVGTVVRAAGGDQPPVYLALYAATLVLLFTATVRFGRSGGWSMWAIAGALALVTFRHRISKTGANSLEGYMHPRMIAFGFGLLALAAVMRGRHLHAILWTLVVACWHPTTALWFGVVVAVAVLVDRPEWRRIAVPIFAAACLLGGWMVVFGPMSERLVIMDAAWLRVLQAKDYLFPHDWPLYAWVVNLAYPIIVIAIYRRRQAQGRAAPGEAGLVAGLAALAVVFLITFPLTVFRVALAVQLQITRVFWLLDFAAAAYIAWWIFDDRLALKRTGRIVAIGLLVAASAGRGAFLLSQDRRLFSPTLGSNPWVEAMDWLRAQPQPLYVLTSPDHGWKYGVSLRLAAEKDVFAETTKDTALGLYDRDIALAVFERIEAVDGFEHWPAERMRALAQKHELDVYVAETGREYDFPELYRNSKFVIYKLR